MKLFPHQSAALEESKGLNRVAYYWDMGLGKTFVGAEKMKLLGSRVNLIVCQKSKIQDWLDHVFTNYEDFECYDLTKKKQLDTFLLRTNEDYEREYGFMNPICGVINYDLVFRRSAFQHLFGFTLMLDESSLIQNEQAKRTKFILNLHPENVILLSGTPVSGKYENLWSQIHLLGWNISYDLFQRQYVNWERGEDADGNIIWQVSKTEPYKHVDRLKEKMRLYGAYFLKTEDCFVLPAQNFSTINVPVSKEYKVFRKDHLVTVGDVTLIGDHVFNDRLYSRQLCGQYSKAKLQAFADLIASTNDRLIVFYNYTAELTAMMKLVEDRPISIVNGSTKDLTAYENEENSITFIQYQAGAMGLNLQKANKIVYFTLTDKSELFEQSKKRIHRIGQDKPCFYFLLICKGSIEEWIYQTLQMRRDFTDELFVEMEDANHGKKNQG